MKSILEKLKKKNLYNEKLIMLKDDYIKLFENKILTLTFEQIYN